MTLDQTRVPNGILPHAWATIFHSIPPTNVHRDDQRLVPRRNRRPAPRRPAHLLQGREVERDGQRVEGLLFAGNSLDKARRVFDRFTTRPAVEANDPATNGGCCRSGLHHPEKRGFTSPRSRLTLNPLPAIACRTAYNNVHDTKETYTN